MVKVVYLIGAGATQAEVSLSGSKKDIDLTMIGIRDNVYKMSKKINGNYFKLIENLGISQDQDIELIMSLFESYTENGKTEFQSIYKELRSLFRKYLVSQIIQGKIKANLFNALLQLHKRHKRYLGREGEILLGVLTTNYDSLIENSFSEVYGGINLGYNFSSKDYTFDSKLPPVLKLHGSFNWKIENNNLIVSKELEKSKYETNNNGWIPPSVFKKPNNKMFIDIWQISKNLLLSCDILRIIGSSLRNEDWSLISIIFNSQISSKNKFRIELIIPTESTTNENNTGVLDRLKFISNAYPLSSLPLIERGEEIINSNIMHFWILKKISEVEKKYNKVTEDNFIENII